MQSDGRNCLQRVLGHELDFKMNSILVALLLCFVTFREPMKRFSLFQIEIALSVKPALR